MKKVMGAIIASSVLMASGVSVAEPYQQKKVRPTYNYAGVKYSTQRLDDFDCSQDGLFIDGSFDINGQVFARGSIGDVSGDVCGSTSISASLGYRSAWGEASHLYGVAGFTDVSADSGGGDTGLVIGGGIRGYMVPGIEGYFEVGYSTLGDGDLSMSVGGAYWFNGNFAATADVGFGSDQRSFAIGARMAF
ncbi:MAG TPA: hypothetical protein VIC26_10150 [Marinagarivorans sp.]